MKKLTTDLTTGSVAKRLILFALPIIFSNLLQQLYSATDRAVVGQFAENGSFALAAVGSTGPAISLLLGLFTGLGIGVNIVCANARGAKDEAGLRRTMRTALILPVICGTVLAIVGVFIARPMLKLMSAPKEVLELATLYMRIYFCGTPFSLLYNFGSAILRAHGDTRRPMRILALSGLLNVSLNLLLVIVFDMSVAGVAIATVASQALSAFQVCRILFNPKDAYKLKLKLLRFYKKEAWTIIKVGVPCGVNGMAFSLSNLVLQSTVNSFGSTIVAGNAASDSVTALLYQIPVGFYSAATSFSGQNYGAEKFKRISQCLRWGCFMSGGLVLVIGTVLSIFGTQIMHIFNSDSSVIAAGLPKLRIVCFSYVLYAVVEMLMGCLRGMRKSMAPTLVNILGICGTRILWVWLVFPLLPSPSMLYLCYPLSYAISALCLLGYYVFCLFRIKRHILAAETAKLSN